MTYNNSLVWVGAGREGETENRAQGLYGMWGNAQLNIAAAAAAAAWQHGENTLCALQRTLLESYRRINDNV